MYAVRVVHSTIPILLLHISGLYAAVDDLEAHHSSVGGYSDNDCTLELEQVQEKRGVSLLAIARDASSRIAAVLPPHDLETADNVGGQAQPLTPLEVSLMSQVDTMKQTVNRQATVIAKLQEEQMQESSVAAIQSQKVAGLMQTSVVSDQQLNAALQSQQSLQIEESKAVAQLQAAREELAQDKERFAALEKQAQSTEQKLEETQAAFSQLQDAKASSEHAAEQVIEQIRQQFDSAVQAQVGMELQRASAATAQARLDEANAQHVKAVSERQAGQMATAMDLAEAKMAKAMQVLSSLPDAQGLISAIHASSGEQQAMMHE